MSKDAQTRKIVRQLVELQQQLLESLPEGADEVDMKISVAGRVYTIRAFCGQCVLIACQEERDKRASLSDDETETLKLPGARDARTG